jgi:drug/metabolite transporter (DMT)-like permease
MLFILPALGASLAYSSDVIFGKLALEEMPMYLFIFILAMCYLVLAIGMFILKPKEITSYFNQKANLKPTCYAVIAIILGTVLADILMWYALKVSSRKQLPIAIALVHTAPLISLLLVFVFFKQYLNWKSIAGVILTVVGCAIAIMFCGDSIDNLK